MEHIRDFLRDWQPVWQFAFYVVFTGLLGVARLLNQTWDRRLNERRARREGIDPDEAEREG